jgi:hypothetical protein
VGFRKLGIHPQPCGHGSLHLRLWLPLGAFPLGALPLGALPLGALPLGAPLPVGAPGGFVATATARPHYLGLGLGPLLLVVVLSPVLSLFRVQGVGFRV